MGKEKRVEPRNARNTRTRRKCKVESVWRAGFVKVFFLCVCWLMLPLSVLAQTGSILDQADYLNQIYTNTPTDAPGTTLGQTTNIAIFSGSIGGGTNVSLPNLTNATDGTYYLTQSAIGQPIGGQPLAFYLPGIALVSPTNGAAYPAPFKVPLDVQAWQLAFDEYVQRVDFYASNSVGGSNILIVSTISTNNQPGTNTFTNTWTTNAPGTYTLTAVATDDLGNSTTSVPVSVAVVPVILVNGQYTNTDTFTFLQGTQIQVTMTNPIPSGFIRYTLDGTDPSGAPSYEGAISIDTNTLVRAEYTDSQGNSTGEATPVTIYVVPQYTLSASTLGGGSVSLSPPGGTYTNGATVTLQATPSNGWSFLGWTGDETSTNTNFSIVMNNSKTEEAVFGTPLTVSSSPIQGGIILSNTPGQTLYPYDSTVLLQAQPSNNWYLNTWRLNGSFIGSNSPLSLSITSSSPSVQAVFASNGNPNFSSLTVEVGSGNGSVTVSPYATLYSNGTSVTITPSNAPGQLFSGWSENASGNQKPLPWTVTSNTLIIANFTSNPPPTVSITNPADGAAFYAAEPISIGATATTAAGSVTNVDFYANAGLIGSTNNAPFAILWSNSVVGTYTLTAVAAATTGLMATSAPVSVTITPATNPAVYAFASANYTVYENGGSVTIYVTNEGNFGGTVSYRTSDGTAFGGGGNYGDYTTSSSNLTFVSGQNSNSFIVPIIDNFIDGSNTQFTVQLFSPSGSGSLGSPATATVTIIRDDPGAPTNAVLAYSCPGYPQPAMNGQLSVILTPPEANGQWHFPWEYLWHTNGEVVSNLVAGNYPVVCRDVPGYLVMQFTNAVSVGSGLAITNNTYYPTLPGPPTPGALTVNVAGLPEGGGGWQFQGEPFWRAPGSTVTNLIPDNYVISFEPVTGYVTPGSPENTAVPVSSGPMGTTYTGTYETNISAEPEGAAVPALIAQSDIVDCSNSYGYVGQLQTATGLGSGVAVTPNVVLTAAHMVFDDNTVSMVPNSSVWWYFQEEVGQLSTSAPAATGIYNPLGLCIAPVK